MPAIVNRKFALTKNRNSGNRKAAYGSCFCADFCCIFYNTKFRTYRKMNRWLFIDAHLFFNSQSFKNLSSSSLLFKSSSFGTDFKICRARDRNAGVEYGSICSMTVCSSSSQFLLMFGNASQNRHCGGTRGYRDFQVCYIGEANICNGAL